MAARDTSRGEGADWLAQAALLFALSKRGEFSDTALSAIAKQCLEASPAGSPNPAEESADSSPAFLGECLRRISRSEFESAAAELECAARAGVSVLTILDPGYPQSLRQIHDPPLVIFVRGRICEQFKIGIVGARRGTNFALNFARGLAKRVTERGGGVVSGLAWGIDAAAHNGALDACIAAAAAGQGAGLYPGIAVLGSGVFNIHPRANERLANELLSYGGALMSEYGLETAARNYFFPRRNRIISGMSCAVAVIEAAERSGSLITARLALEQGRDVYAVPGSPGTAMSKGTNKLIKDGAVPLLGYDDVFESVPEADLPRKTDEHCAETTAPTAQPDPSARLASIHFPPHLAEVAKGIIALLKLEPEWELDRLQEELDAPVEQLLSVLGHLQVEQIVGSTPYQSYYLRNPIDR